MKTSLLLSLAASVAASPALAETYLVPNVRHAYQYPATCSLVMVLSEKGKPDNRVESRCWRVSVSTQGLTSNIHYATADGYTFSFVIPKEARGTTLPVIAAVALLNNKQEMAADAMVGDCRLSQESSGTFVQCSMVARSAKGATMTLIGTAGFRDPLYPPIRALFR